MNLLKTKIEILPKTLEDVSFILDKTMTCISQAIKITVEDGEEPTVFYLQDSTYYKSFEDIYISVANKMYFDTAPIIANISEIMNSENVETSGNLEEYNIFIEKINKLRKNTMFYTLVSRLVSEEPNIKSKLETVKFSLGSNENSELSIYLGNIDDRKYRVQYTLGNTLASIPNGDMSIFYVIVEFIVKHIDLNYIINFINETFSASYRINPDNIISQDDMGDAQQKQALIDSWNAYIEGVNNGTISPTLINTATTLDVIVKTIFTDASFQFKDGNVTTHGSILNFIRDGVILSDVTGTLVNIDFTNEKITTTTPSNLPEGVLEKITQFYTEKMVSLKYLFDHGVLKNLIESLSSIRILSQFIFDYANLTLEEDVVSLKLHIYNLGYTREYVTIKLNDTAIISSPGILDIEPRVIIEDDFEADDKEQAFNNLRLFYLCIKNILKQPDYV